MVPSALLAVALWQALKELDHLPEEIPVVAEAPPARRLGAMAAFTVFVFGAIPMVVLGLLPGATADVAAAQGAGVAAVSLPAPNFTLTDQNGQSFTLSSQRGHVVVLTFLDPVCNSECPTEAQQMRAAAQALGANSGTQFVAVNANPRYLSVSALQAFDTQQGLTAAPQWHFLTGSQAQLQAVWNLYGVTVAVSASGAMVSHSEPFYVINRSGVVRSTWLAVTGDGANSVTGKSGTSLIVEQVKAVS
jgi:protein SCO1/2